MKRKILVIASLIICVLFASVTSACDMIEGFLNGIGGGGSEEHKHNYSIEWSSDDDYHWRDCLNDGCDQPQGTKNSHFDSDGDGKCNICGHGVHVHKYEWVDNGNGTHKQHCGGKGCELPDINEDVHDFGTGGECVCGATGTPKEHVHNYEWETAGDGTHRRHCTESGCDEPYINEGPHHFGASGVCVCGAKESAEGHVHDYKWINNGDGTHKQHCIESGCGEPDINKGAHSFGTSGVCVCGAKEEDEVHKHVLKAVARKTATCTAAGNYAYFTCSGCDGLFMDGQAQVKVTLKDVIIEALGHVFDSYKADGNATCVKDGTETAVCSRCKTQKDTRVVEGSALGHDLTYYEGREATCLKYGWESYAVCSRCDYNSYKEIPATGHHTMQDGTCTVCGAIDWESGGLNLLESSNGTYGYDYLGKMSKGAARQSLYNSIDEAVKSLHNDVETNYSSSTAFAQITYSSLNLTADDAVAVWKTYVDDNPLYYWFSNEIRYSNTYLALYVDGDYLQGSVRKECNQTLYNEIREYLAYAEGETGAYRIALAFHDKIINSIDYAYDLNGVPEESRWAHSITGVFEGRGAVCEGYAKAFQLLLNLRGVGNVFVTGLGNGGAHAWNLIKLDDGQWYWCDLTWDDAPGYEWGICYNYFCVNDWQGTDWADGNIDSGNKNGHGIGGSPSGCENFLTLHKPFSSAGSGINFMVELPARSATVYEGTAGELKVRDTFEVDGIKYAVAGYRTVQVTKVSFSGAVVIPDRVDYLGDGYTVISIGGIGETKLFGGEYVFDGTVTSVTLPSTVIFIWSRVFYRYGFTEIKFGGTAEQWSNIEKLDYWKNSSKTLTVRCNGGTVTE